MQSNKGKLEGFKERMEILCSAFPYSDGIIDYAKKKYRRYEEAKDDILDALVAATAAYFNSLLSV
jgi:predicted RNase H-like nuclease